MEVICFLSMLPYCLVSKIHHLLYVSACPIFSFPKKKLWACSGVHLLSNMCGDILAQAAASEGNSFSLWRNKVGEMLVIMQCATRSTRMGLPAMKETTGFFVPLAFMKSAASSSALPPISPIMIIPSVYRNMAIRAQNLKAFRLSQSLKNYRRMVGWMVFRVSNTFQPVDFWKLSFHRRLQIRHLKIQKVSTAENVLMWQRYATIFQVNAEVAWKIDLAAWLNSTFASTFLGYWTSSDQNGIAQYSTVSLLDHLWQSAPNSPQNLSHWMGLLQCPPLWTGPIRLQSFGRLLRMSECQSERQCRPCQACECSPAYGGCVWRLCLESKKQIVMTYCQTISDPINIDPSNVCLECRK